MRAVQGSIGEILLVANLMQTDFSGGVLTPKSQNRVNGDRYEKSVSKAINWVFTSQGSASAREGTKLWDMALNPSRHKRLFEFPAHSEGGEDVVIEIDSNGLKGDKFEGNLYYWVSGTRELVIDVLIPDIFGDLSTMESVWDTSSSSLVLASKIHAPFRLLFKNGKFTLTSLYGLDTPIEWGDKEGYPNTLAFFQDRLWFGGNNKYPTRLWATITGSIDTIIGEGGAGKPESLNIQPLIEGYVQWMISSSSSLSIGTSIAEYILRSSDGEGISAANLKIDRSSGYGSNGTKAMALGGQVIFTNMGGNKIYASNYVNIENNWIANEISHPAQHLFRKKGSGVRRMKDAHNPDNLIYILSDDGNMSVCCYDRQNQTNAWSELKVGSSIVDIALINGKRGQEILMLVNRSSNGKAIVSMESLRPTREFWFRADSYELCKTETVGNITYAIGIERFNNSRVDLATIMGTLVSNKIAKNGKIELPRGSEMVGQVYIGYHIENVLKTLRPSNAKQSSETIRGSKVKTLDITLSLYGSVAPTVNGQVYEDVSATQVMGARSLDFSNSNVSADLGDVVDIKYDSSTVDVGGVLTIIAVEPFICELTGISSRINSKRI